MSVDRGFTSAFGGTFGVVLALFVIFFLMPMLFCVGCGGLALIGAGVSDSVESTNRARIENKAIKAAEERLEFEKQQAAEEEALRLQREQEDREHQQRLEELRERNRIEMQKEEAAWYRDTFDDRKAAADDNTQELLNNLPKPVFK